MTKLEELKAQRDELNLKIKDLEEQVLGELKAKAADLGLQLIKAEPPKKERRKRRTREEMEQARANGQA